MISLHFGPALFGQYAATVSAVILVGGLASAGPAAATTLGVARRWASIPGSLPTGLVRFLVSLVFLFLLPGAMAGLIWPSVRGAMPAMLWVAAVTIYVWYQVVRAFGYAIQHAPTVTQAEIAAAVVPLIAVGALSIGSASHLLPILAVIFAVGPATFLVIFCWRMLGRTRAHPGVLSPSERRAGMRESAVFFVGAGSSMAMQYLPVIIAGRLQATTTAAMLFGAVQATAPLLLLSRVYGAVMMPAFAGDNDAKNSQAHLRLIQPFFLTSLAVALGLAPWVTVSLGLAPQGEALSVGALVALMTLMQVWSTPAVTILSARGRELVPAIASLSGLVVAMGVWAVGLRHALVASLPVGLALGAVVRSLVPMWVISGHQLGRLDSSQLRILLGGIGVALVLVALGRLPSGVALIGGAILVLAGLLLGFRIWRRDIPVFQ